MSKSANAGELRTPVRFIAVERSGLDAEGYPIEQEVNVFGEDAVVMVKWSNVHGTEVFSALQLEIKEPATITMRYSPLITPKLLVYKNNDQEPYEIISVDNVEERCAWLEIKVKRKVPAR